MKNRKLANTPPWERVNAENRENNSSGEGESRKLWNQLLGRNTLPGFLEGITDSARVKEENRKE